MYFDAPYLVSVSHQFLKTPFLAHGSLHIYFLSMPFPFILDLVQFVNAEQLSTSNRKSHCHFSVILVVSLAFYIEFIE